MDQESRIKIETAVRVRNFFATRPFGNELADAVVASFGEMVAEVISLAQIEIEGRAAFHASSVTRTAMRDRIRSGNPFTYPVSEPPPRRRYGRSTESSSCHLSAATRATSARRLK